MLNQLPLGLVDGHSKCKPDRELLSLHVKANGLFRELELDPGDEDLLSMVASTKQTHLQDLPPAAGEDGPSATTESIRDWGIEMPGGLPGHGNACSGPCIHPA